MPYVSTSHGTVHYEVDGQGPGLVLVHGVGGDARMPFGAAIAPLGESRTVIRPELSGSGRTADDGADLSAEMLADQVVAVARRAADGPVDLVGFSLGAAVAVAVAALEPRLVRRLILIGGATHTGGPRAQFYFDTLARLFEVDRELFKRVSTLTGFSPEVVDAFGHEGLAASLADEWPPPGISRQLDLSRRLDVRPLLPLVDARTLVIGLVLDQMAGLEGSIQLHAGIDDSRLEVIDGGHMDWSLEPSMIVKLIQDFLADS